MKIRDTFTRGKEEFTVIKVYGNMCLAISEFGFNIIRVANISRIK